MSSFQGQVTHAVSPDDVVTEKIQAVNRHDELRPYVTNYAVFRLKKKKGYETKAPENISLHFLHARLVSPLRRARE